MDIGHMIGANKWPGDSSGWGEGVAQASVPVTNLSPHVSGGGDSSYNGEGGMTEHATLRYSVALVAGALGLLWFMGMFAFKSASL